MCVYFKRSRLAKSPTCMGSGYSYVPDPWIFGPFKTHPHKVSDFERQFTDYHGDKFGKHDRVKTEYQT